MVGFYTTNDAQSRKEVLNFLDDLDRMNKGKNVLHIIKKVRPVRSIDQNKRYWLVIKAICSVTGNLKDDQHEEYKEMFNGGESTADLDTEEFSAYAKEVEQHGKNFHGLKLKEPKDKDYERWMATVHEDYKKLINSI